MRRILVLYAHPDYGDSRANSILASHVRSLPGVTFRNLYEECEGFFIDEHHEQRLLLEHDLIVFQHPFHWYSCPALLKEWQDVTLRKGWAYGEGGTRLTGKSLLSVVTTGGSESAYSPQGHNRFTIQEFLRPFEQTAYLCHMRWLQPLVVYAAPRVPDAELHVCGEKYAALLTDFAASTSEQNGVR